MNICVYQTAATMDDLDQAAPTRGARGRWAPGRSGNPAGKKPGTPNRATRLRALLADGDDALAAQVLMDKVRAGDGVAARFVLDRLFPKPRDRDIDLALPPPEAGTTLVEMLDRVLWLMAAGEVNIDEASRMARLIVQRRNEFGAATPASDRPAQPVAAPAAGAVSPAFDLQTAGEDAADPGAPAASPPLNRHERRRAAALQRMARAATAAPLTAVA
ncbi:MAG: hypothetical protein HY060_13030 [Proteobacteria bacterium]|nr:hypothetical protein [Pseudomonadota bacterium]